MDEWLSAFAHHMKTYLNQVHDYRKYHMTKLTLNMIKILAEDYKLKLAGAF